jgi:hypothetical protein
MPRLRQMLRLQRLRAGAGTAVALRLPAAGSAPWQARHFGWYRLAQRTHYQQGCAAERATGNDGDARHKGDQRGANHQNRDHEISLKFWEIRFLRDSSLNPVSTAGAAA